MMSEGSGAPPPSRSAMYEHTWRRITSIPAESEYDPTLPFLQPERMSLALALASSGNSGDSRRGGYETMDSTCLRKVIGSCPMA